MHVYVCAPCGRDNLCSEGEGGEVTTTGLLWGRFEEESTLSASKLTLADTQCFQRADTPVKVTVTSANS